MKKKNLAIIHYANYNKHKDQENYCRKNVMLICHFSKREVYFINTNEITNSLSKFNSLRKNIINELENYIDKIDLAFTKTTTR